MFKNYRVTHLLNVSARLLLQLLCTEQRLKFDLFFFDWIEMRLFFKINSHGSMVRDLLVSQICS